MAQRIPQQPAEPGPCMSTSSPTWSARGAISASAGSKRRSRSAPTSPSTSTGGRISSIPGFRAKASTGRPIWKPNSAPPNAMRAIAERVAAAAAMEGLVYAPDKMSRQPNTLDCHRLILWSRSATDPARMKQRLMELYFAEGADLTDPKILIQAAVDCGMDGDLVRRLLASDADVDRIEERSQQRQGSRHRRRPLLHLRRQRHRHRRAIAGISRQRHRAQCPGAIRGCRLKHRAPDTFMSASPAGRMFAGMTVLQKRGCSWPRRGLDSGQSGKNKRR